MTQKILISQKENDFITKLLGMTGPEIYDKYGLKRDETITHTAKFEGGIEADIKLVICEEDKPYVEGVLFLNGCEIYHTDCEEEYTGEWEFEYDGNEYVVNVVVE